MYRHRNLDIAIATIVAILGGLAAAKQLPGQIRIPLGVGLFFAPGYLWSQAILSQRLPGFERAMTALGMALIFPIIGGFLFYAMHIPLFQSAWIGLLVVMTLAGVVAVAIQRLREAPEEQWREEPRGSQPQYRDPRDPRQPQRPQPQQPREGGSLAFNVAIYGLAGLIAIGAITYSVNSAKAQKFPGYTALSMTGISTNNAVKDIANLSDNQRAQDLAQQAVNEEQPKETKAHLTVTNYQGATESYKLTLLKNNKVLKTFPITLEAGKTWQQTIAYSSTYSLVANLYLMPDSTKVFHCVDNGIKPLCK